MQQSSVTSTKRLKRTVETDEFRIDKEKVFRQKRSLEQIKESCKRKILRRSKNDKKK